MCKFKHFMTFFLTLLFLSICLVSFAQPGDPGGDSDVPISGIEWLLIGGGIFGARKVYKNFKNTRKKQ